MTKVDTTSDSFRQARDIVMQGHHVAPDFPEPGVKFVELLRMLYEQPHALQKITAAFKEWVLTQRADAIAVIDARGFIFGAPVASELALPLVAVRKQGKLPPPVRVSSYHSEYAGAAVSLPESLVLTDQRVVVIDDVLATGGTVKATLELLQAAGAKPVGVGFVGEIAPLHGRACLSPLDVFVLVSFFTER
jgi:adenine phosphoribosyltransferase